jgi:hypothetical protein
LFQLVEFFDTIGLSDSLLRKLSQHVIQQKQTEKEEEIDQEEENQEKDEGGKEKERDMKNENVKETKGKY